MKRILLFLMLSVYALSYAEDFKYSISPYLGYHYFGDDRDKKDKPEFGLKVERFLQNNLGFEVGLGYVPTERGNGKNVDLFNYHTHLKYYFGDFSGFEPYASAGLGGDITYGMNIGPSVALGAKYKIVENIGIFAEIRDNYLFGNGNDVILTAGLNFYVGKKAKPILDSDGDGVNDNLDKCPNTPKGVKVDKDGCPLDTDGDGVYDYLDKCPDTPKGVKVNSEGCPLDSDKDGVFDHLDKCPNTPEGVKVDKDGCPLDSDKDGVYDYLDKCPGTPEGVKVDSNGCPLDSDKDGVYDYLDKCPGTPEGVKVDANGCPLDSDKDGVADYLDKCPNTPERAKVDPNGCPLDSDKDGVYDGLDKCPNSPVGSKVDKDGCEISISLMVFFDTNRSEVKEQYYDEIEKVAKFMKQYPDIKIEIAGHTDSRGSREKNIKLSQERAAAVANVLVKKFGISKDRVSAKGYGPDKPIYTNETEEGRQKNRRVEAVIIK